MAPLSIFRINGLAAADATQLAAFAGFLAMFSFLTLYMQNVLGYSPIQTGIAYLPVCFAIGIAAGISSQVLSRMGTRPVIVAGALISAGGIFWLSQIPVDGSCLTDLLPGMIVMWIGFGPVFEGVTTAANAGVPGDKAGLAASLVNAIRRVLDRFEGSEDSSLVTEALVDLLEWIDPGAAAITDAIIRLKAAAPRGAENARAVGIALRHRPPGDGSAFRS